MIKFPSGPFTVECCLHHALHSQQISKVLGIWRRTGMSFGMQELCRPSTHPSFCSCSAHPSPTSRSCSVMRALRWDLLHCPHFCWACHLPGHKFRPALPVTEKRAVAAAHVAALKWIIGDVDVQHQARSWPLQLWKSYSKIHVLMYPCLSRLE